MEQVAGKPSWHSKVANVHLTKHTVALVYMLVCVSIQQVSHKPNVHPADNRWMEMELLWYDVERENTSERSQSHYHCPQQIAYELPLEQIQVSNVKNQWMSSRNVAQNWLAVSPFELWHRPPDWLYHQWSCGTGMAGCITSGAVPQTWLTVSPVELWHRPGWFYHQWVVHIQNLNRTQIKPLQRTDIIITNPPRNLRD